MRLGSPVQYLNNLVHLLSYSLEAGCEVHNRGGSGVLLCCAPDPNHLLRI